MAYDEYNWKDGKDGGTAITAARLNHMEKGIAAAAASAPVASGDIEDASAVGKDVLTAKDAAAARTAIGAGTSSLAIGTTATTALAGNTKIPSATATGNAAQLEAGTDTTSRSWTAKDLAAEIDRRIAANADG